MRFRTIWTLPGDDLREKLSRTREYFSLKIAARIPQRIKYYVVILEVGKATMNSENVPATPLDQILQNLDKGK